MINTFGYRRRHKVAIDEFTGIQNRFADATALKNKAKGLLAQATFIYVTFVF